MSAHADTIRHIRELSAVNGRKLMGDGNYSTIVLAWSEIAELLAAYDALVVELEAARQRADERDEILSRWYASYPETVFRPLSADQVAAAVEAIQATGITSDALHAAWARHILNGVMLEIRSADAARGALARIGASEEQHECQKCRGTGLVGAFGEAGEFGATVCCDECESYSWERGFGGRSIARGSGRAKREKKGNAE